MLTAATPPVQKSGNVKTGPITVTNRSIATCPSTCPFLDADKWEAKGCYGAGRMWAQVEGKVEDNVTDLPTMTALTRDRVLGDITVPIPGDDSIDWEYVQSVQDWAARDKATVFGYTHAALPDKIASITWEEEFPNYVMNVSCHTPDEVREATMLGWPTVISTDDLQHGDMIDDLRVVECPAVTHGVTCEQCGLCARPLAQRRYVILFRLHGVQVKKARAAVAGLLRRVTGRK